MSRRASAREVDASLRARRVALVIAAASCLTPALAEASPWSLPRPFGVLAAPASSAAAADSADPMAEAQEAFQLGTQAYALGNYDQAVALFERSYALSGRPELLFNLGQAYAQWYSLSGDLAHLRKARKLYQNYIKFLEASDGVDPEAVADTEARIAEIDGLIAAHVGDMPGETPPEGPTPPSEPEAGPGPATPPPPHSDTPRPLHRKGWFWGVVVGAAVVIAASVTIGVLATRDRPLEPELGTIRGTPVAQPLGIRF